MTDPRFANALATLYADSAAATMSVSDVLLYFGKAQWPGISAKHLCAVPGFQMDTDGKTLRRVHGVKRRCHHDTRVKRAVPVAVHGTYLRFLHVILEHGVRVASRHRVYMHASEAAARAAGVQVLIFINVALAMEDGIVFYCGARDDIITAQDSLLAKYISSVTVL
jgi:RNA:NAD 2'-phosphotransferase (TPT1/KptA family)